MKKTTSKVIKVLLTIVAGFGICIAFLIGLGFLSFDYSNENATTDKAKTEQASNMNMNDFNAESLTGNNFTSEDLKKHDLTMVNIWYTGCKPCVDKMPETQELYEQLPDNVNMVSLCVDGNENKELASKIVKDSNVKYPALIPDEKLNNSLVNNVSVFPTTIFVDKDGNIVGDVMEGAPASGYAKMYLEEINRRLEMLKK